MIPELEKGSGLNHCDLSLMRGPAALFEVRCGVATFGVSDGIGHREFIRDASTPAEAVMSAIHQVESVASLQVMHLESDDISASDSITLISRVQRYLGDHW